MSAEIFQTVQLDLAMEERFRVHVKLCILILVDVTKAYFLLKYISGPFKMTETKFLRYFQWNTAVFEFHWSTES